MPSEPPGADPHAGWCGGRRGKPGAYPMTAPAERSYLGFASPESPTIIHGEPDLGRRSPAERAAPHSLARVTEMVVLDVGGTIA